MFSHIIVYVSIYSYMRLYICPFIQLSAYLYMYTLRKRMLQLHFDAGTLFIALSRQRSPNSFDEFPSDVRMHFRIIPD